MTLQVLIAMTAADGTSRFGCYRWIPEAGEAYLSPDEANKCSANFLREELESRLQDGPVEFRLFAHVAAEIDQRVSPVGGWHNPRVTS